MALCNPQLILIHKKCVYTIKVRASNSAEEKTGGLRLSESCEKLVESAKKGDVEAFDKLVFLHQDQVYARAYRILGNAEDSADVQQETFIHAWRNLRKFRQEAQFSTWLHRIAVNLCLSMRRRKGYMSQESLVEELHIQSATLNPAACHERAEALAALRRVLAGMPTHYRILLVLRDMEERSFREIAEILGCSVASARTRLCKARNMLRARMRPYIVEEDR